MASGGRGLSTPLALERVVRACGAGQHPNPARRRPPPPPQLPTPSAIGFNVETVQYKNLRFQVWDLGGQTSIRPYWRCYYQNTNAIIYVVDSADPERMGISKQELITMLEEEELKDAVLMVFANKQDLPNALATDAIADRLGLSLLKNRRASLRPHPAVVGAA